MSYKWNIIYLALNKTAFAPLLRADLSSWINYLTHQRSTNRLLFAR